MNNENNKNNTPNSDSATNHQLGMLGLAIVGAVIWKNEDKIRLWFYNNVLFVVLGSMALLSLAGFYLWYRFKKKEAEHFERRRQLREVQTRQKNVDYYKRRDP
jgi:LPXTG-motif cell wall-anchored protein